ncbi:MAG: TadE/TadG family type IV pilus assembly protein [Allosphingosinicella sp.]
MTMARILSRLRRDEKGASLIEFGLLAPVLALMVGGVVDLSEGLSERFQIQQAVNRSLEQLQSLPPEADANKKDVDYAFLTTEAKTAAGPTATVTLTKWLECDGAKKTSWDDACAAGEDTARYVHLRIDKTFNGVFFMKSRQMTATGAVRVQ